MAIDDPRAVLDALIRARGEDYASLSRLLGRNPAYVQQFIKRGVPRRLDERDRALLARYFGVDEARLGAPDRPVSADPTPPAGDMVEIRRFAVDASAGPGRDAGEEAARPAMLVDRGWLRRLAPGATRLALISVSGDSMAPTLGDGDDILVDHGDAGDRLRDGIYVIRRDDALMVKRVTLGRDAGRVSVTSDNAAYPGWPDCAVGSIDVIGRVMWAGRRLP